MLQTYKSPGIFENYIQCMKRMFDYHSRSRRSEWWKFALPCWGISFILLDLSIRYSSYNDNILLTPLGIFWLIHLLPYIALLGRRLHDTGHTAGLIVAQLLPFIGQGISVLILIYSFFDSQVEDNEWGESPKYYDSDI